MGDELRQSFTLLPRRSEPWIWISKPGESCIKKFICRRSVPTATLSVKGPTKNELRRSIMFSSHPSEPMVNERGLSDPSPGNDCNDIYIPVFPCTIQKSAILLSTKDITSGDGQSGYGNLLRSKSCRRFASSDTRSRRGRLLKALMSDFAPCVESACYRRYCLQKFGRVLKTMPGVFLEEHLKQHNDRLWGTFEQVEW